jgi:hypothetical protein
MNVRCFFKFAFCWSHNENFENYNTQQQKISLRPNKKMCGSGYPTYPKDFFAILQ